MRRYPSGRWGRLFRGVGWRIFYPITWRVRSLPYRFRAQIYRILPPQVRWMVPIFQREATDTVREDFKRRWQEWGQVREVVSPEAIPAVGPVSDLLEVESRYSRYACVQADPLACRFALQTVEQDPEATVCTRCGFPAPLRLPATVAGLRGQYQITRYVGRRGLGRLYAGVQLPDQQPICLKEYVLPARHFNTEETRLSKEGFKNLAGLNLADGRSQDFRLVQPWDAIADFYQARCYVINQGNGDRLLTLREYLATQGPLSASQVRRLLNQVLQTLESLHGQKFRLPTGQIRPGLIHGNLSLDSLLMLPNEAPYFEEQQFLVYVCDLYLWEHLFEPPPVPAPSNFSVRDDLTALGFVAFYALVGRRSTLQGQLLNPRDRQHWPETDPALQQFILRLLDRSDPFSSAESARRALLQLPPLPRLANPEAQTDFTPEKPRSRTPVWWWIVLGTLIFTLLALWLKPYVWKPKPTIARSTNPLICCIKEVTGVPKGEFTYAAQKTGTWRYILEQDNLVDKNTSFATALQRQRPKLGLKERPVETTEDAIALVESGDVDFAIVSVPLDVPSSLTVDVFAYDGLAVFTAFNYTSPKTSLLQDLQGRLNLTQLRQLYTGQVKNWQELGGPNLPVELYLPAEPEAMQVFAQKVLTSDRDRALFQNLASAATPGTNTTGFVSTPRPTTLTPLPTFVLLRTLMQNFESGRPGGIGFAPMSKVFGQCAVYPWAIAAPASDFVQPLLAQSGQPITPKTDLCKDKGSYRPNLSVFQTQRYSLAYPLAVVYRRDNSRSPIGAKFAEILRTQESQKLLSQAGLVPLQTLPNP